MKATSPSLKREMNNSGTLTNRIYSDLISLIKERDSLIRERDLLRKENNSFRKENDSLHKENSFFRKEIIFLGKENSSLGKENDFLGKENDSLYKEKGIYVVQVRNFSDYEVSGEGERFEDGLAMLKKLAVYNLQFANGFMRLPSNSSHTSGHFCQLLPKGGTNCQLKNNILNMYNKSDASNRLNGTPAEDHGYNKSGSIYLIQAKAK